MPPNIFFRGDYNDVRENFQNTYNGNYYDLRGSQSPHNIGSFNRSHTVIIDSFNNDGNCGSGNLQQRPLKSNASAHIPNPSISLRDRRKRTHRGEHDDAGYEQHSPIPPPPRPRGWTSPGPQRPQKPRHPPRQDPTRQWPDAEVAGESEAMYANPDRVPHRQNKYKNTTLDFDTVYGGEAQFPAPPVRRVQTLGRPSQQRASHSDPTIQPAPGAKTRKTSNNPFLNGNIARQSSLIRDMNRLRVAEQPTWEEGAVLVAEPEDLHLVLAHARSMPMPHSHSMHDNEYSNDRPRKGSSLLIPEPEILEDYTASIIALRITSMISDEALYRKLLHTERQKAQRLVDISQAVLESPIVNAKTRRELVVFVQRFSKRAGVYPRSYMLEGVKKMGLGCAGEGAFGTVRRGVYQGKNVCLKFLKQYGQITPAQLSRAFARETILWRQLNHRNILPFYGICELDNALCMVSPWMRQGDLREYIKGPVTAEERTLIARDIAKGLGYLHSYDIVHGDLKGANVLVDGVGRACIADFGLTSINDPNIAYWASQSRVASKGGNFVFQAPELLQRDNVENSKASDIYAWGCLCYELYVGEEPYKGLRDDVIRRKLLNEMPNRPHENSTIRSGLTERMWSLMVETWDFQPEKRPNAEKVVARVSEMIDGDPRPLEEDEQAPEAKFISRWCRGQKEGEQTSPGMHQRFKIPTVEEVDELLKPL